MHPFVFKFGGFLLFEKEKIVHYVRSFFPYHIDYVDHFQDNEVTRIYKASSWIARWGDAYTSTMETLVVDGAYRIRAWNPQECMYVNYFLSATQIAKACGLRSVHSWWAMSDFGIIRMLSDYVHSCMKKQRILAILIDGKDVTAYLKPYIESLSITKNVTARHVCELYYSLCNINPKKHENRNVAIVDYDLNETWIKDDEYLFESFE